MAFSSIGWKSPRTRNLRTPKDRSQRPAESAQQRCAHPQRGRTPPGPTAHQPRINLCGVRTRRRTRGRTRSAAHRRRADATDAGPAPKATHDAVFRRTEFERCGNSIGCVPSTQQLCRFVWTRGDVFAPLMTGNQADSSGTDRHRREPKTPSLQGFRARTGILRRRSDPLMGNHQIRQRSGASGGIFRGLPSHEDLNGRRWRHPKPHR
jgi:hypothetical protein